MYLTKEEEKMLDGEMGVAAEAAMKILVALGDACEAKRLIPVSSVHISGGTYYALGDEGIEWLDGLVKGGAKCKVPTTRNPGMVDHEQWKEMGLTELLKENQGKIDNLYKRIGVIPINSCLPYLLGNIPLCGAHFAWGGSSGQVFANSVLGARGNREGGPANIAASIIGKTPEYGLHLTENRYGEILVKVEADAKKFDVTDYAILGYFVGRQVVEKIPVFTGLPKYLSLEQLRAIAYSLPVGGAVPMFHIVGVTPEAKDLNTAFGGKKPDEKITVTSEELKQTKEKLSSVGRKKPDLVCFGCPHCTYKEIKDIALMLKGKRIDSEIRLWVCTAKQIKEIMRRWGLLDIIEKAGGLVISDVCASVGAPFKFVEGVKVIATNSVKTAFYAPGTSGVDVIFAETNECINAAITGRWEG